MALLILLLNACDHITPFTSIATCIVDALSPLHRDLLADYFKMCGMNFLRDEEFPQGVILRGQSEVKTKAESLPGLPYTLWAYFSEARFTKSHKVDSVRGLP
jgi:hypothetical protein